MSIFRHEKAGERNQHDAGALPRFFVYGLFRLAFAGCRLRPHHALHVTQDG